MGEKKHKPPSRIKYEKNNPVWSVRLTKELYAVLNKFLRKSMQSRRKFVAIALKKQYVDYSKIRDQAYNKGSNNGYERGYEKGKNDGYNKGMNQWAIWVYCYNCWKEIFIKPNSKDHKEVIEEMKGRLIHDQSPED